MSEIDERKLKEFFYQLGIGASIERSHGYDDDQILAVIAGIRLFMNVSPQLLNRYSIANILDQAQRTFEYLHQEAIFAPKVQSGDPPRAQQDRILHLKYLERKAKDFFSSQFCCIIVTLN